MTTIRRIATTSASAAALCAVSIFVSPSTAHAVDGVLGGSGALAPLRVGDVLATGFRDAGRCVFDAPVSIAATVDVAVSATVTETCALVVSTIETQSAADTTAPLPGSAFVDDDPVSGSHFAATLVGDGTSEPRVKIPRSGHTKFTVREQFNITAYEIQVNVRGQQDTKDGTLSGGTYDGTCYASAFPGNQVSDCYGRMPSRGGQYVEAWGRGDFDNVVIGPHMVLFVQHDITKTGFAGRCDMLEGSLPPLWSTTCQILKHS